MEICLAAAFRSHKNCAEAAFHFAHIPTPPPFSPQHNENKDVTLRMIHFHPSK